MPCKSTLSWISSRLKQEIDGTEVETLDTLVSLVVESGIKIGSNIEIGDKDLLEWMVWKGKGKEKIADGSSQSFQKKGIVH